MACGGKPAKPKLERPGIGTLLGMGVAAAVGAGIRYGATKLHEILTDDEKAAKKLSEEEEVDYVKEKSVHSCGKTSPDCAGGDGDPPTSGGDGDPPTSVGNKDANLHDSLEAFYKQHVVDTIEDEISPESLSVIEDVVEMFRHDYNKRSDVVGRVEEGNTVLRRSGCEDEFDVRVPIVLGRKRWKVVENSPGCLMLRARVGSDNQKLCATPDGYLSTAEMLAIFHSVCKSISKCTNAQDYVLLPDDATKLVVEFGWETLTVNLVPQLVIDSKCLLAEAPSSGDDEDVNKRWRQNFYTQEEQIIQDKPASPFVNKCLSIVSSICHRNAHLDAITSDMLRTVMLHVLEGEDDWTEQSLPERFIDFFICLERYLLADNLPHYFLTSFNLFERLQPSAVEDLKRYVSGVIGMNRFHELLKNVD